MCGRQARIWTDASFAVVDGKPHCMMCAIIAEGGNYEGIVWTLPDCWCPQLVPRDTQIVIGELPKNSIFNFDFPKTQNTNPFSLLNDTDYDKGK